MKKQRIEDGLSDGETDVKGILSGLEKVSKKRFGGEMQAWQKKATGIDKAEEKKKKSPVWRRKKDSESDKRASIGPNKTPKGD